jgi:hypothetical protein
MQAMREQIDRENRSKKVAEDVWEPTYSPELHKNAIEVKPHIKNMYHIIKH